MVAMTSSCGRSGSSGASAAAAAVLRLLACLVLVQGGAVPSAFTDAAPDPPPPPPPPPPLFLAAAPDPIRTRRYIIWILVTAGVAIGLVGACVSSLCWWRRLRSSGGEEGTGTHDAELAMVAAMHKSMEGATVMALRDLRRATSNFSESSQIGAGGFGVVYRGQLANGTTVAIKRCRTRQGSAGGSTAKHQFLNEVKILCKVNHRHLVRLLGCCLEKKMSLLVLEYVPNGTLCEHLQRRRGTHLSWQQRLRIAVQTAEALAYLHSAANPPIFHRDVKSANILLDQELNAKVADFGISKLVPLEATHASTRAIRGTLGYIDPEYYQSFQLTAKSDVYAFGVVLLELLSGKAPVDFSRGHQDVNLVTMAVPLIKSGDLHLFLDPAIEAAFCDPHGRDSIQGVASLAIECLRFSARQRPSMTDVLAELRRITPLYQFSAPPGGDTPSLYSCLCVDGWTPMSS